MKELFGVCNDWMYDNLGCPDWDMEDYCWRDGFWSWRTIVDNSGNVIDEYKSITRADLQAACDNVGIEIDCINF